MLLPLWNTLRNYVRIYIFLQNYAKTGVFTVMILATILDSDLNILMISIFAIDFSY